MGSLRCSPVSQRTIRPRRTHRSRPAEAGLVVARGAFAARRREAVRERFVSGTTAHAADGQVEDPTGRHPEGLDSPRHIRLRRAPSSKATHTIDRPDRPRRQRRFRHPARHRPLHAPGVVSLQNVAAPLLHSNEGASLARAVAVPSDSTLSAIDIARHARAYPLDASGKIRRANERNARPSAAATRNVGLDPPSAERAQVIVHQRQQGLPSQAPGRTRKPASPEPASSRPNKSPSFHRSDHSARAARDGVLAGSAEANPRRERELVGSTGRRQRPDILEPKVGDNLVDSPGPGGVRAARESRLSFMHVTMVGLGHCARIALRTSVSAT
jgi:hypothetical protein